MSLGRWRVLQEGRKSGRAKIRNCLYSVAQHFRPLEGGRRLFEYSSIQATYEDDGVNVCAEHLN